MTEITTTITLRYWPNGNVEILPHNPKNQLRMFITFKCGVCNHFVKREDIKIQPKGQAYCPHCNYHFEE